MSALPTGAARAPGRPGVAAGPGAGRSHALLDASALTHNLAVVRAASAGARVMAVVKADAYGHGLDLAVPALAGADAFAVATLSEARALRSLAPRHPVLLLQGVVDGDELALARHLDLWLVVHSDWQIDLLEAHPAPRPTHVWLKVDTGMHRLGLPRGAAQRAAERLRRLPGVDPRLVLMSHLANADDLEDRRTDLQLARFAELRDTVAPAACSLANSAGALAWPASRHDWVRPGLALYGASPIPARSAAALGLRRALTLRSTLIAVNRCRAGDAIGYGGSWRCPEDMPVGVVGAGYGDGYPRHAPSGTPVLIQGTACPLVGRVSMDMLCVDLRPLPTARVGDEVELWGTGLAVERVAEAAETIAYELLCGLTRRVPVRAAGDAFRQS